MGHGRHCYCAELQDRLGIPGDPACEEVCDWMMALESEANTLRQALDAMVRTGSDAMTKTRVVRVPKR